MSNKNFQLLVLLALCFVLSIVIIQNKRDIFDPPNNHTTKPMAVSRVETDNEIPLNSQINLQWGTIDTRVANSFVENTQYDPSSYNYYIVQFEKVILPEWAKSLTGAGAEKMGYIPQNSFLAEIRADNVSSVQELEHVSWVGLYKPEYKYIPDLFLDSDQNEKAMVTIMTFPNKVNGVVNSLEKMRIDVLSSFETELAGSIRANIYPDSLDNISNIKDVMWIEEYLEPELN